MNTTEPIRPQDRPRKLITQNRKALHEYFIVDRVEAGIVLRGTEVKSLREGKCNLQDSYAFFKIDKSNPLATTELWVTGMHISPYFQGNINNHEPTRMRKLLMHKKQLAKLYHRVQEKGITLVPLSVYFSGPYVKMEIGLAKGKKMYDKRQDIRDRDVERSLQRLREH